MRNPTKLTSAAAMAATTLALASCGGGGSGSSVTPTAYLQGVCGSIGTWVRTVASRTSALAAHSPTSPAQGKREFETFMTQVLGDTDTALSGLRAAGKPNVTNGNQIASVLVTEMSQARDALARAQTSAQQLPTDNRAKFAAAANQLAPAVQHSLAGIGAGLAKLKSPELDTAATKVKACQALT
jgi:hypothetical protein